MVRDQLRFKGMVYTFRRGRRRKKLRPDYAVARRGGHKIADVIITPIMHVEPNRLDGALRSLLYYSGFDSVKEWLEHIYSIDKKLPEGWIYRVDTINRNARAQPCTGPSASAKAIIVITMTCAQ